MIEKKKMLHNILVLLMCKKIFWVLNFVYLPLLLHLHCIKNLLIILHIIWQSWHKQENPTLTTYMNQLRSCTSGVCQLTVVCQESKPQMRLVTVIVKIMSQRLVIFMFWAKCFIRNKWLTEQKKIINIPLQTVLKETFNPLKPSVLFLWYFFSPDTTSISWSITACGRI